MAAGQRATLLSRRGGHVYIGGMPASDLVQSIRNDVTSGASSVVRSALAAYRSALEEALDAAEARASLVRLTRELVKAQPAMAPVFNLGRAVLSAAAQDDASGAQDGASDGSAVERVRATLDAFEQRLEHAQEEVARRAEGLMPAGGRVLTLSASGTVRTALLHAAARRPFDVVCLEGRPNLEGRRFAASLAEAGLDVILAVDAAAALLLRGCDVAIVGADSIGDLGVVNKIGTRLVAMAAKRCGVPIYALADTTKLLPAGRTQPMDDPREADEVWRNAPGGVTVWNQYFEATPVTFFDGVVMEDGLHSAAEIDGARAELPVPAELA